MKMNVVGVALAGLVASCGGARSDGAIDAPGPGGSPDATAAAADGAPGQPDGSHGQPDGAPGQPDGAPATCYDHPADGTAHLLAMASLPATSMQIINPALTSGELAAALANGGMTMTAPGIGSGVDYAGGCPGTFWFATDRGPNGDHLAADGTTVDGTYFPLPAFTPTLVSATFASSTIAIDTVLPLVTQHGAPITGLPNDATELPAYPSASSTMPLAFDPNGLDVEEVRRLPSGDFLVSEENSPSVALVDHATGKVVTRYVPAGLTVAADTIVQPILPAIFTSRRPNHGFEGLALSADGKTAYAVLQSPMGDETDARYKGSKVLRVVRLDVSLPAHATVTGDFLLAVPDKATFPAGTKQHNVLCSAAAWLGPDRLLLLLRGGGEVRLVTYSLGAAADVSGKADEESLTYEDVGTNLGALGITPAAGTKAFSTLDLPVVTDAKLEGLAVLSDDVVALTNDNDFGIADPTVPTHLWIVQTAQPLR